jgi:hypothetical protein
MKYCLQTLFNPAFLRHVEGQQIPGPSGRLVHHAISFRTDFLSDLFATELTSDRAYF